MTLLRAVSRTMLASYFVSAGIRAIRDPRSSRRPSRWWIVSYRSSSSTRRSRWPATCRKVRSPWCASMA